MPWRPAPRRGEEQAQRIPAAGKETGDRNVLERYHRKLGDGSARALVEVRLRSRADYGSAATTLDRAKRERLLRAARALEQQGVRHPRVDVVAIDLSPTGATLTHHRNAIPG